MLCSKLLCQKVLNRFFPPSRLSPLLEQGRECGGAVPSTECGFLSLHTVSYQINSVSYQLNTVSYQLNTVFESPPGAGARVWGRFPIN